MADGVPLATRRIPVGSRKRLVAAPAGDPFLKGYGKGGALSDFSDLCRRHLRPDDVVLDVGANIGLTVLVASDHLPAGRVVAVEASPRNCAALRDNLRRHPSSCRIEVVESAAGAESGTIRFFDNSAYGHVVGGGHMAGYPAVETRMTTVDDLATGQGLDRLDLLKLDVEGFEEDVLDGASATLARFDPIVVLEFNSWCQIAFFDRNPRRFLDRLLAQFPQLYAWRGRRLTDIRELTPTVFLRDHLTVHRCVTDLVACGPTRRLDTGNSPDPWWRGGALGRRLRLSQGAR